MINNVVLVGRLTKDAEVRMTTSGKKVCGFTLAVNKRKTDAEQTADFISCVVWEKGAEILQRYTRKGSQIGVQGSLQTRSYQHPTHSDVTVYVTEVLVNSVTLLDSKGEGNNPAPSYEPVIEIDNDDLPF